MSIRNKEIAIPVFIERGFEGYNIKMIDRDFYRTSLGGRS